MGKCWGLSRKNGEIPGKSVRCFCFLRKMSWSHDQLPNSWFFLCFFLNRLVRTTLIYTLTQHLADDAVCTLQGIYFALLILFNFINVYFFVVVVVVVGFCFVLQHPIKCEQRTMADTDTFAHNCSKAVSHLTATATAMTTMRRTGIETKRE